MSTIKLNLIELMPVPESTQIGFNYIRDSRDCLTVEEGGENILMFCAVCAFLLEEYLLFFVICAEFNFYVI